MNKNNSISKFFSAFLFFCLFSSMGLAETGPILGTVKILPLGDSITDSFNGRASYRRPLWHQLIAAGYAVDFVGRPGYRHSTVPESLLDYDIDHEGHARIETQSIRDQISGWMNLLLTLYYFI